jgi:hypothetical protein
MTKIKMDWSNTIIYKIVCNDVNVKDCYVGSTTSFSKRKYTHKSTCNSVNNKHHNLNVYQFIRSHGGWDNWCMVEVEKYEAVDSNDARKRERYYIEKLDATLNKVIPTQDRKEYRKKNKSKIVGYRKEHYENKKDKILQRIKRYYMQNKQSIDTKRSKKCKCMCGGRYVYSCKARHLRTSKHQQFETEYENYILQNNPSLEQLADFIRNRNSKKHYIQQFKNVLWHE